MEDPRVSTPGAAATGTVPAGQHSRYEGSRHNASTCDRNTSNSSDNAYLPAELIADLESKGILGFNRLASERWTSFTIVEIDGFTLADNLAHLTAECLERQMTGRPRPTEIEYFVDRIYHVCRIVYARLIYSRLRSLARTYSINQDRFTERAQISHEIAIPTFAASVISRLGVYKPHNTEKDVVYLPHLSAEQARGACLPENSPMDIAKWLIIYSNLYRNGIKCAKVDFQHEGSPWYLLTADLHTDDRCIDLILTLPPSNFSHEDLLAYAICRCSYREERFIWNGDPLLRNELTENYGRQLSNMPLETLFTIIPSVF